MAAPDYIDTARASRAARRRAAREARLAAEGYEPVGEQQRAANMATYELYRATEEV